jgi:hypothetical protein
MVRENVDKVVYDGGQAHRVRQKVLEKEVREKTM